LIPCYTCNNSRHQPSGQPLFTLSTEHLYAQCAQILSDHGHEGDLMEREITDTITSVDEKEWEMFSGHDYVEKSYAWYRTVEESGMRKVHYVFVRENGTLTAAASCLLFKERMYTIGVPLLEVFTPLGTSQAFFSKTPEQAHLLVEGLEEIRKKERAVGVSILCLRKEEFTTIKNQVKGFTDFPGSDNTYIDLNFTDFEDYLSSLDGKSRRSVRITLNKAKKLNIKPLFTNDFSTWKDVAYRLQGHLCAYHKDYRWLLNDKFYEALERNVKENAELLLFFKDDIPLAFGLSVNSPTISQYKFAGIDPQYRKYHAYFLIYYEGIKRALERRQKRIYFGLTGYSFKEKIGCKREELFGLAKMKTPVFNVALQSYAKFLKLLGKKS